MVFMGCGTPPRSYFDGLSTSGLSHPWIWRTSQSGFGELRRCKGSLTEVWGLPTIVRLIMWALHKGKGQS